MKLRTLILCLLLGPSCMGQTIAFTNGNWWISKKFVPLTIYSENGRFTFSKPARIDSTADLTGLYCIPPFGDAHTHNLDGLWGLEERITDYLKEGVFYVQVLGNYGSGAVEVRKRLERTNQLEVRYANALLTATYGHGFYPYEPLAMGIYSPADQLKYADSIKKSRKAENDAYLFLDSISDVDKKWPLIMKYKPDHLKICLLDAADYEKKRKAEQVETYGLSPSVAEYVVKKAHKEGLRVFAHVETAEDARLCARIGVDVLAHLPGYGWNGADSTRKKFCLTWKDIKLLKKAGIAVIPTMNIDNTAEYLGDGKFAERPLQRLNSIRYEKETLREMLRQKLLIGLGADHYGKTVQPEIDSLVAYQIFTPSEIIDLWARQTTQLIFPGRKIGEIKEGYEASFLVLENSPLQSTEELKKIRYRIKQGKFIIL